METIQLGPWEMDIVYMEIYDKIPYNDSDYLLWFL